MTVLSPVSFYDQDVTIELEVVDVRIQLNAKYPYGSVSEGRLTIKGRALRASLGRTLDVGGYPMSSITLSDEMSPLEGRVFDDELPPPREALAASQPVLLTLFGRISGPLPELYFLILRRDDEGLFERVGLFVYSVLTEHGLGVLEDRLRRRTLAVI
jgi:hypothetical protein